MAAPTSQVTKVSKKRGADKAASPGQLDRYDDGSWEFTGNGNASAQDVAANIIDYEKQNGQKEEYGDVRPDALAKMLLQAPENQGLNELIGGDVARPIPAPGPSVPVDKATFKAEASTLKQMVTLLMQHESRLKAGLALPEASSESDKLTGKVSGNGLTLPYEPG